MKNIQEKKKREDKKINVCKFIHDDPERSHDKRARDTAKHGRARVLYD